MHINPLKYLSSVKKPLLMRTWFEYLFNFLRKKRKQQEHETIHDFIRRCVSVEFKRKVLKTNPFYVVKYIEYFISLCENNEQVFKIVADNNKNLSAITTKVCSAEEITRNLFGFLFIIENEKIYSTLRRVGFDCMIECDFGDGLKHNAILYGPLQLVNHGCGSFLRFAVQDSTQRNISVPCESKPTSVLFQKLIQIKNKKQEIIYNTGDEIYVNYGAELWFTCKCPACPPDKKTKRTRKPEQVSSKKKKKYN